jgi:hypothetical protein
MPLLLKEKEACNESQLQTKKNNTEKRSIIDMNRTSRFPEAAESHLSTLYGGFGATTTEQKITVLKTYVEGQASYYALGGEVSQEMILGCLEYEYLSNLGLIELVLA